MSGYSLRECDKRVEEHCGTLSLLKQAETGYQNMGQFDAAYSQLYKNPEVQKMFGVEELAYIPSNKSALFNQLMTDHRVSEGSINFGNGINPDIEEGQFVRSKSMFNDMGTFQVPSMDAAEGTDMETLERFMNERQQEARSAVAAENRIISVGLKREFGGDLEGMMESFYKHQLDRRGGSGKSSLDTKLPATPEALSVTTRYDKYGIFTSSTFNGMEQQAQIDYLTKEFFRGDTSGLEEYMRSKVPYDYVVQQRRETYEDFADLEAREQQIMDLESQKGKGAVTQEGDETVEPKGGDDSPRSIGATMFSDPNSRASGSFNP